MEGKPHLDSVALSGILSGIRLISGGQTGIDRAVLDFCLDRGIPGGGWCPEGRLAEDGPIDPRYPVRELPGAGYVERTLANVRDSDATVIIFSYEMEGGTLRSFEYVLKEKKPFLLVDLSIMDSAAAAGRLGRFLVRFRPGVVNFSGARRSEWREGYGLCFQILDHLFS